jgi:CDP-glucose 4,6-dehydratase
VGDQAGAVEGVAVNPEFWRGKRVLITGHTGFKGSWLSLWLQKLGAQVSGYSLAPPPQDNLFTLAAVGERMESVFADIRDRETLRQAFDRFRPEIVFHLAAQALVRASYTEPVETYQVNVMGTVHVLEAVRNTRGCRAVVNVTSDKCYENKEWTWGYREQDPMGGHDPYSSSKGCSELVTAAYRCSFFGDTSSNAVGVASARAGNVIGGGDFSRDRIIPDFMAAFAERKPLYVRNPDAVRPWQHVLEPLSGYLLLAEKLWEQPRPKPHEAGLLMLDSAKARMLLGWTPRWSLDEALRMVVGWHTAHQRGEPLRPVVQQQIDRYQSTATLH